MIYSGVPQQKRSYKETQNREIEIRYQQAIKEL